MASSCSNSSNLLGNINITTVGSDGGSGLGGARLLMTIPLSGISGGLDGSGNYKTTGTTTYEFQRGGVTAGDVLRYNAIPYDVTNEPTGGKYVKSLADRPEYSEVIGVVETIDVADKIANVVISGQIKYPSHRLFDALHIDETQGISGAGGGQDVYFLSAVTGGYLQNLAPSEPTTVAKPVLQKAIDPQNTDFNGIVVNYIGYQVGGEIVASSDEELPAGTYNETLTGLAGGNDVINKDPCRWILSNNKEALPITMEYSQLMFSLPGYTYSKAYSNMTSNYGRILKITCDTAVLALHSTGKVISQRNNSSIETFRGTTVSAHPTDRNSVYVKTMYDISDLNTNKLYINSVAYEITAKSVEAFYLPQEDTSTRRTVKIKDINGVARSEKVEKVVTMCPDQTAMAVSVPGKVTVQEITIRDKITVENSTVSIDDLADAVNTVIDEVQTVKTQVLGAGTSNTALENLRTTK